MSGRKPTWIVLVLVSLLAAGAQAQNVQIQKGFDVFQTPATGQSGQSFSGCPVMGYYFAGSPPPPEDPVNLKQLTSCEDFSGTVYLQGAPLETFRGVTVGAVDTIVERTSTIAFNPNPNPSLKGPQDASTEVELVALNLISISPLEIACMEESTPVTTHWEVRVQIDELTGPSTGEMTLSLNPEGDGGAVISDLQVCPRVTFTRVDPGASGSFEIYPCDLGCGPQLIGATEWSVDPAQEKVLKIEDFTTDNFNFSQGSGTVTLKEGEGVCCPSEYLHQEATAAHLCCTPCVCAEDTQAPALTVPSPNQADPVECTVPGGTDNSNPDVIAWFDDLFCADTTNEAHCGPFGTNAPSCQGADPLECCDAVTPCSFCPTIPGNPPTYPPYKASTAHCDGNPNDVNFWAEDSCGNCTQEPSKIYVADTTGPTVTPDSGGNHCIWSPNHNYVCFDKSDFSPVIDDLCFGVDDWHFVDCASSQPDPGPGNNSNNDCVVRNSQDSFCVRTEVYPSNSNGRYYAVEIEAVDDCGNVGPSEVIGTIWVPPNNPPPGCIPPPPLRCTVQVDDATATLTADPGTYTSYSWDFDDGDQLTNGSTVTHTYGAPDVYAVVVTALDNGLPVATAACTVDIPSPTVICSPDPITGTAPFSVSFDETGGDSTSWSWDFTTDGSEDSTAQAPSFTYSSPGTYTATVTGTTDDGLFASDTCTITVDPPPPPTVICSPDPITGTAPLNVSFDEIGGNSTSWSWDFTTDGSEDSTLQAPSFTYSSPGTYTATVTGTANGVSASDTCSITVNPPPPPTVVCSADPVTAEAPLTVSFDETGGDSTSWSWDFTTDGSEDSTAQAPSFTYNSPGIYTATVTGTVNGVSASDTCTILALEAPPVCDSEIGVAPNHDLEDIDIADKLNLPPGVTVTVDSIWQDELVKQNGGDDSPDGSGVGTGIATIRSERFGSGDGRVYVVRFTISGGATPPCGGDLTICVPQGGDCILSCPLYDSTQADNVTVSSPYCP